MNAKVLEETNIVNENGLIINTETGEVIGVEGIQETFEVKDVSSAEWVMEKMQICDSDILALEARKRVLIENIDSMIRPLQRKRDWLETRYGEGLQNVARGNLKDTKTWKNPFGWISFRIIKGGLRVKDKDKALEWALHLCPEAIKVSQEFQISRLPEDMKNALMIGHMTVPVSMVDAFEVTEDRESVTIQTGVK